MSDLPRISGLAAIGALERLGFVVLRQKGSHVILRRGNVTCVVPQHRELKVGTLRGVLRQASVDVDDFISVLG